MTSPENGDTQNNTITKTTITKTNNKYIRKSEQILLLEAQGICGQVANDFLTLRKAKHAPLTETALSGILREAAKAKLTALQVITLCVERNWISFKADWLMKEIKRGPSPQSVKDIPKHTTGGAFLAKDIL